MVSLDLVFKEKVNTWDGIIRPCLIVLKYSIGIDGNMIKIEWTPEDA
jgi:hypothetical protein